MIVLQTLNMSADQAAGSPLIKKPNYSKAFIDRFIEFLKEIDPEEEYRYDFAKVKLLIEDN